MLTALLTGAALLCHGQLAPPDPAEERRMRIQDFMTTRAEFGFRADRAYVRELIRRGMWEYDVGDFPATPAENRYLRQRDRLDLGRRAHRYLRARPDLSGGISVEDAWPRRAYLLVRVTERPAHHRRALRRLSPAPIRVRRVQRSERSLRRLQNRISFERHERDGFHVQGVGVDIDANRVEIDLITARTDHAQYFRRAYGPWVRTIVSARQLTRLACTRAASYRPAADGLVVHWTTGGGAVLSHVEVTESADRVEIGVVERVPNGARTLEARFAEQLVRLSAPLGDRRVIDAATGRPLPRGRPRW